MPPREELGLWAVKHTAGAPEQLTMNALHSAALITALYTNQKCCLSSGFPSRTSLSFPDSSQWFLISLHILNLL